MKTKMMLRFLLPLTLGLSACEGTDSDLSLDETELGQQEQALGEQACGTNALTTRREGVAIKGHGNCAWTASADSDGPFYGSPGCQNQFIVEITNLRQGEWATPFVRAYGDQSANVCNNLHLSLAVYATNLRVIRTGTGPMGIRLVPETKLVGTRTMHGKWHQGSGMIISTCEYVTEKDTIPAGWVAGDNLSVRVVGDAYFDSALGPGRGKIEVGLSGGNPC